MFGSDRLVRVVGVGQCMKICIIMFQLTTISTHGQGPYLRSFWPAGLERIKEVSLLLRTLRLNMCFLNSQLSRRHLLSVTSLD